MRDRCREKSWSAIQVSRALECLISVTFPRALFCWDPHTGFPLLSYIADRPSHVKFSESAPLSFPPMPYVLHSSAFYHIIRLKEKEWVLA